MSEGVFHLRGFLRRRPAARRPLELEFLPAALEIMESPPSPVGRAIGITIVAAFMAAVVWSWVGSVDIVAVAPGRLIPSERTKVVQPFEIGIVRAIHVREGQAVKAGDPLIDMDSTTTEAESERLGGDLLALQLDAARMRAVLADGTVFSPPEGATPQQIEVHRRLYDNQLAEHRAKLTVTDRQLTQKEAEQATVQATIAKIEATLPLLRQRVDTRKYLADREYGSKLTWLAEQQELVEREQERLVLRSRLREAEAATAALRESREQTDAEFRRTILTDLAVADQKAAALRQEVLKAGERQARQRLTAPVDGTVQQLAVHTVGGVVTPAQPLMVVVPADSRLEVEAMIANRDIGFVQAGQEAEVKVDAFSFTRYGLLRGTVRHVSADAMVPEKTGGDAQPQPSVYGARVALDSTVMHIDERDVALSPGMTVTLEIKTGRRRIIDFVLSPVLRYRQESLRER